MAIRYTGVSKMNNYIRRVCENPDELGMALRIEFDRLYELIAGTARRSTGTLTADYTISQSDDVLFVDATTGMISLIFPSADRLTGDIVVIKIDASANIVRLLPSGTDTVDGASFFDLDAQRRTAIVMPDVNNWYILARRI